MKKGFGVFLLSICMISLSAQNVELVKYDQLEKEYKVEENKLLLVNFWATWCGPCIREIPHFQEADKRSDIAVYLVSVDFPQDKKKVENFVEKRNLDSRIFLLDEKDYDYYMPKVSENWTGAIPATLVIDSYGNRYFYEQAFTKETLQTTIDKHLN